MSDHGHKPAEHSAHDLSPAAHASVSQPGHHSHGGDDHGDHGGIAVYVKIFVALCVLTGASFFTYSEAWPFHDHPSVGWAFMMAVSCTKALLVMLFFMHLKWEADWKYVLTIPASVMSVFLVLALVPDIGRRVSGFYPYSGERLEYVATDTDVGELVHQTDLLYKGKDDGHGH